MDAKTDTYHSTRSIRAVEMQNSGSLTFYFLSFFLLLRFLNSAHHSSDLTNIECQVDPEDRACNIGKSCKLQSRELRGDRYLHTCKDCPDVYPWIKNEFGLDI